MHRECARLCLKREEFIPNSLSDLPGKTELADYFMQLWSFKGQQWSPSSP